MMLARRIATLLRNLSPAARRRNLRDAAAREVRDELDFHLEMRAREIVAKGVPIETARERAMQAFGNRDSVDAECRRLTTLHRRRARREGLVDGLSRDLLSGARALRSQPLLTVAAVVILACGFAATNVVYGLVDALLLQPLPVAEPQRLVSLFNYSRESGLYSSVSHPDYLDYRANASTITDLVGYTDTEVTLGGGDAVPVVRTAHVVTANYFRDLGVNVDVGRPFGSDQPDEHGRFEPVLVIGHALWRQRFAGDPGIVGTSITLNGLRATVVGVAPAGFRGLEKETIADLWIPIGLFAQLTPGFAEYMYTSRGAHWLTLVGRLAEGASLDDARAEMSVLSEQQAEAYADVNGEYRLRVFAAAAGAAWPDRRDGVRTVATILTVGVALVLLIACANVTNLLLVRAAGRQAEFGMRLALGAGRVRLIRQLLAESFLLALASGLAGVVLALWARMVLATHVVPAELNHLLDRGIDGRNVAVTVGVVLMAGLAFGLAPALRASRPDLMASLKAGGGSLGSEARRLSLGNGLVVAQIALSLPLLVSAVLIGQSLWNRVTVDLGVQTGELLLVEVDPGSGGYNDEQAEAIYDGLLQRVTAMPGVLSAAYTKVVPLGTMRMATDVVIPGRDPADGGSANVEVNVVSPGYAAATGIQLVRGRDFVSRDTSASEPVVLVNEAMADRTWPGADPVGKLVEVHWFGGPRTASVVGVLADHAYARVRGSELSVSGTRPRIYLPLKQEHQTSMTLLVRTGIDAETLTGPVIEAARTLAPASPDIEVVSFRAHVAGLFPQHRLVVALLAVSGAIGLVLAAVGVYAVTAYSASRRTREMGIRLALGARRGDVLRLVVGEGLLLALAGITIGAMISVASSRLLASMLYGVEGTEPTSYLAVATLLLVVALSAGYLPGRRAADSDPLAALRRP